MEPLRIIYDRQGQTLTVWFGDPSTEYLCEETAEEIILMKNKQGEVIGLEKLHFSLPYQENLKVTAETVR